jgi:hypothetical protein
MRLQVCQTHLRVSTREQRRSDLGLAAQRYEIEVFGERDGVSVKSWYQDVQTGAGTDALLLRPGLAGALVVIPVATHLLRIAARSGEWFADGGSRQPSGAAAVKGLRASLRIRGSMWRCDDFGSVEP